MTDIFESLVQVWIDITGWVCEGRSQRQVLAIILASFTAFASTIFAIVYMFRLL